MLQLLALARDILAGKPAVRRSPKWDKTRDIHITLNPYCIVCGSRVKKYLVVHHVKPFHLWPELELVPENLVTMCESQSHNCHLMFGHFLDFKRSWNPDVIQDATLFRMKLIKRPMRKSA
jgi:hypothetical protein